MVHPDPTECVSYRLRRAARLAAKSFDAALKPAGLRNTQFTLIAALAIEGEKTIGELAATLATDATTLNRNLEVLVKRGLIDKQFGDDARVRTLRLTGAGSRLYDQALPLWTAAQQRITDQLGSTRWPQMMTGLSRIETACGES